MKKIVSVSLSVLLVASLLLTGCGGKKPSDASSAKTSQNADAYKNITWDSPDLSWKKNKSPVTIDCYIDFNWYAVDKWGQDDVSKEITKRTGVTLNVTKGTDVKQLQVMLASDQLPEMIFTANQVQRFYDPSIVYPFDELISKYAPEFKSLLDPAQVALNTQEDGHFYALKTHYHSDEDFKNPKQLLSTGDPGFFVREDIMQALGNPKLDSLEDLQNIFKTVKEKYPDMIVYLPHPTWQNPMEEFMGLSNSLPYRGSDNKLHLGWTKPEYLDYLKYYNELYRNGYVSQEAFTYKPDQFTQIINSGKVFAASYNTGLADASNKFYDKSNIKAHFVPVTKALTWKGQTKFAPIDASIGWASAFITKKCKNPDRAIQYLEFLKSPEGDELAQWGIEGKHYTKTDDGLIKRTDYYNNATPQQTGIPYWYFMANDITAGIESSSRGISNPKYHANLDVMQFRKKYYKRDPVLALINPPADSEEMTIQTKIEQLFTTAQISMITAKSEADVEAQYNKLLDNAKKIGMDKLDTFMTQAYDKNKARYDAVVKQSK